jgi:hypothetical protein
MTTSLARTEFGETFTDWVLRLRADCSRRRKLARATNGSAFSSSQWPTICVPNGGRSNKAGSLTETGVTADGTKRQVDLNYAVKMWPTPDASIMNERETPETFFARQAILKAKGINGNGMGTPLALAASMWPTPATRDYKGANSADHLEVGTGRLHLDQLPNFVEHLWQTPATDSFRSRGGDRKNEAGLDQQARQWATPRASDSEKGGPNQSFGEGGGIPLPSQAAMWPTPRAGHGGPDRARRDNGKPNTTLETSVAMWSTPRAHEVGQYTRDHGDPTKQRPSLTGQAFSHQDPTISTDGEPSSKERRTLNPLFVEWLMGWPPGWTGWTACACSETVLSAWRRDMRCALLALALPHAGPPAQLGLFG